MGGPDECPRTTAARGRTAPTKFLVAGAEEEERHDEGHDEQQEGAGNKNRPRRHISGLHEGENDEKRRYGSRDGEVVEVLDGGRLRGQALLGREQLL